MSSSPRGLPQPLKRVSPPLIAHSQARRQRPPTALLSSDQKFFDAFDPRQSIGTLTFRHPEPILPEPVHPRTPPNHNIQSITPHSKHSRPPTVPKPTLPEPSKASPPVTKSPASRLSALDGRLTELLDSLRKSSDNPEDQLITAIQRAESAERALESAKQRQVEDAERVAELEEVAAELEEANQALASDKARLADEAAQLGALARELAEEKERLADELDDAKDTIIMATDELTETRNGLDALKARFKDTESARSELESALQFAREAQFDLRDRLDHLVTENASLQHKLADKSDAPSPAVFLTGLPEDPNTHRSDMGSPGPSTGIGGDDDMGSLSARSAPAIDLTTHHPLQLPEDIPEGDEGEGVDVDDFYMHRAVHHQERDEVEEDDHRHLDHMDTLISPSAGHKESLQTSMSAARTESLSRESGDRSRSPSLDRTPSPAGLSGLGTPGYRGSGGGAPALFSKRAPSAVGTGNTDSDRSLAGAASFNTAIHQPLRSPSLTSSPSLPSDMMEQGGLLMHSAREPRELVLIAQPEVRTSQGVSLLEEEEPEQEPEVEEPEEEPEEPPLEGVRKGPGFVAMDIPLAASSTPPAGPPAALLAKQQQRKEQAKEKARHRQMRTPAPKHRQRAKPAGPAANPSGRAAYRVYSPPSKVTQIYHPPPRFNNVPVVRNCLTRCLLAGAPNYVRRTALMDILATKEGHCLIALRSVERQSLHSILQVSAEGKMVKVDGPAGMPEQLPQTIIDAMFKFDSASKQFVQVEQSSLSTTVVAVVLRRKIRRKTPRDKHKP